ncbi:hypothetical protein LCGC14_1973080, partial [marine sediment metagenome]
RLGRIWGKLSNINQNPQLKRRTQFLHPNPFRPPGGVVRAATTTTIDITDAVDASELRRQLIPDKLPRSEQFRRRFGRHVDLAVIENALLQADSGLMGPAPRRPTYHH